MIGCQVGLDDEAEQIGILVSSGMPVGEPLQLQGLPQLSRVSETAGEGEAAFVASGQILEASSSQLSEGRSLRCRETLMNLSPASLKGCPLTPPPPTLWWCSSLKPIASECIGD